MSDTPETDNHLETTKIAPGPNLWASADFARKLERERDEAKKLFQTSKSARKKLNDALDKTLEENRELRAEVERANKDNESLAGRLTACELERDFLGSEMERLKADKARLDWLEKRPVYIENFTREAIDAAMKGAE